MSEYIKQAKTFLKQTNTTFKAEFLENGYHFDSDKEPRDIYKITLTKGSREYTFNFGQSIIKSGKYKLYGKHPYNDMVKMRNDSRQKYNHGLDFDKNKEYSQPTAYDILACLTDYDPGTFENFCDTFGYDVDSISTNKTYEAVKDEYSNVCMLWNDKEIELLQEIC